MQNEILTALKQNIAKHIVGKETLIEQLLICLLAGGHVLLEDVPGVGKTTLAKALADSIDCSFSRIQFTPDTLPSDVVGMNIYNIQDGTFRLVKGAIAGQIVLADEINRTSPKTQASLLEAMEERQITIDGTTIPLEEPFMVIATENPMDAVGTYALPEAQLDRFMMKLSVGYPDEGAAKDMARRFLEGSLKEKLVPVAAAPQILEMKQEVEKVLVHDDIISYVTEVIRLTRVQEEVRYGASPRASLVLLRASQARAYLEGRDFVIPEDVYAMAQVVLPHRLELTVQARMAKVTGHQVITKVLSLAKV